jgi:hypothetical protein
MSLRDLRDEIAAFDPAIFGDEQSNWGVDVNGDGDGDLDAPGHDNRDDHDDPPLENCDGCVDDDDRAVEETQWQSEVEEELNGDAAESSASRHGVTESRGADDDTAADISDATQLPDEFWRARPELEHIRRAAHSRMCSADAVLHTVVARVAADIPHAIFLPAIVRVRSPLCFYGALVGPPGGGKTGGAGVGAELLPVSDTTLDSLPIGSGEGFADILFTYVTETTADGKPTKVKKQTRHNAYWYIDEGQILADLASRSGTTITAALRSAWSGAVLGNTNADPEKRRNVPAGSYTFGVTIGFQPTKAAQLLADGAGGTPQRFVWASATDPHIPEEQPTWPGPLEWRRPPCPTGHEVRRYFEVADVVVAEIRAANLARTRGDTPPVDELDAHRLLLRLRVAALLSLLTGPTLAVTADDWQLASMVMDTSDAVRAGVLTEVHKADQEREHATSEKLARRQVHAAERTHEWHVVEAARAIHRKVRRAGSIAPGPARSSLSRPQRELWEPALEHALDQGWVTDHEEPGQGTPKHVLEPGPETPK